VPNTYVSQGGDHLALILPGRGYRATMPALYFPELALLARGADVLRVEYAYDREPAFERLSEAERDRWLRDDVLAALDAGLAQGACRQGGYRQLTLVGKSLGTLAIAHLLAGDPRCAAARCLWLTPVLIAPAVRAAMLTVGPSGLLVIGSADPFYEPALVDELLRACHPASLVLAGADHSLELPSDLMGSLRALEQMARAVLAFLG
ncbi:MAG: hypothetical protein V1772_03245, partial [Chloroflexota bacterium]